MPSSFQQLIQPQPWRGAPAGTVDAKLQRLVSLEALCNAHYRTLPGLSGLQAQTVMLDIVRIHQMLHPSWYDLLDEWKLHEHFIQLAQDHLVILNSWATADGQYRLTTWGVEHMHKLQNQLLMNGQLGIEDIVSHDPFAKELL